MVPQTLTRHATDVRLSLECTESELGETSNVAKPRCTLAVSPMRSSKRENSAAGPAGRGRQTHNFPKHTHLFVPFTLSPVPRRDITPFTTELGTPQETHVFLCLHSTTKRGVGKATASNSMSWGPSGNITLCLQRTHGEAFFAFRHPASTDLCW